MYHIPVYQFIASAVQRMNQENRFSASLFGVEDISKSPLIGVGICRRQSIFQTADKKDRAVDEIDSCGRKHGKYCQIF